MKGFNSKLIHGNKNYREENKDVFGALRTPIYDGAAFEFESAEKISDAFHGKVSCHSYSRITNPTVSELENKIAYISDAEDCICMSSGMAAISNINYPGLKDNKYYDLIKRDYNGVGGSLLSFELESREKCFEFLNSLNMVRRATNLCENKTLATHPSSTIFCEYSQEEQLTMGISDKMIRLSVGIENIEDIIEDIKNSI